MQPNYVSQAEAQALIPDKTALYRALERNEYILPPLKDPMCTEKWLKAILHQEVWCLQVSEVSTLKVCPDLPSRKELADIVADAMEKQVRAEMQMAVKRTAQLVRKKKPDRGWLIKVLSTVNPGHAIFQRTYRKPAIQRGEAVRGTGQVANRNHFFDGLEAVQRTGRGRLINLMSQSEKDRLKRERLEKQVQRAQRLLASHEQREQDQGRRDEEQ